VNEDKSTRYNRRKRLARLGSLVWRVLLLAGLVLSGGSAILRSVAGEAAAPAPAFLQRGIEAALFTGLLLLLVGSVDLPIAFYDFALERRYGLSIQPVGRWLADQAKALAIQLIFGTAAATTVYFFIRRFPDSWWLPAGIVFTLITCGLATFLPVLLLPLFYRVRPLDRESLRARLVSLADRAGARVLGVYEWGLSDKTRAANAALTGLGRTRRILVSDTMLADYSEEEIEIVLAHELAHHVHGDLWRTLVLESALILSGLYLSAQALRVLGPAAGLRGPDDLAGLPIVILAAGAASLVGIPAAYAISREHERRADRFALALTENPAAFISAMRRLGAQNLAEDRPSRLVQWLFYSHPPIRERIAAAESFAGEHHAARPAASGSPAPAVLSGRQLKADR